MTKGSAAMQALLLMQACAPLHQALLVLCYIDITDVDNLIEMSLLPVLSFSWHFQLCANVWGVGAN